MGDVFFIHISITLVPRFCLGGVWMDVTRTKISLGPCIQTPPLLVGAAMLTVVNLPGSYLVSDDAGSD